MTFLIWLILLEVVAEAVYILLYKTTFLSGQKNQQNYLYDIELTKSEFKWAWALKMKSTAMPGSK
jgi:hypothetical protein